MKNNQHPQMKNIELASPKALSPAQRAAEIATILANAIVRALSVDSNPQKSKEIAPYPALLPRTERSYNPVSKQELSS